MRAFITSSLVVVFLLAAPAAFAQEEAAGDAEELAPKKAPVVVPDETAAEKERASALKEAPKPTSLQDLLDMVQTGFGLERQENRAREDALSQKLEERYN